MELGFVESMRRRWNVLGITVDEKGKGKESENWIYSLDKFIISLVSFLGSRSYQSQHQVWILYYNLQQCSHFPDNVDFSLVMLARLQEETASSILDRKQTRWGFEFSILFFFPPTLFSSAPIPMGPRA